MSEYLPATKSRDQTLPLTVVTATGASFDPDSDNWNYRDAVFIVYMDFSSMRRVAPHLISSIKHTFIWYAEHKSANHLTNLFQRLQSFLTTVCVKEVIHDLDLMNYQASLPHDKAWYLAGLSVFLRKWYALGYPGIANDAVAWLDDVRIKGNAKGTAVRTMDPVNGPYSAIEYEALQAALNKSYADGQTNLAEYVLVWLFMLLGQRPSQYASLKVCDVISPCLEAESPSYILRMPRAKQRGKLLRQEFKERLLTPQIGRILLRYAEQCERSFRDRIDDPAQAPLFPESHSSYTRIASFAYHRTSKSLASCLTSNLNKLCIQSERTGELLHVNATRFRRTLGTRAAMEGHGELVIAEMLDHSDTQSVGVYVQATPEIVERIDRAVAFQLAPLANAFMGTVISDESMATRGKDPTSRIVAPHFDKTFKPMANCGRNGVCGLSAPIACYTCSTFEPWLDGPHEAVLDHLLAERERLMKSADKRIASINDRTIIAVAQVVRNCREIIEKSLGASDG